MKQYLNILEEILENGVKREDRTGVGTLSIFGTQTRYDLSKGYQKFARRLVKFGFVTVARQLVRKLFRFAPRYALVVGE